MRAPPRPLYRTRPRGRLDRAQLDVIWVMYYEGELTIAEIAKEVHRSPHTVSVYLRELRAAYGGMSYLTEIGENPGSRPANVRRLRSAS